jgi:hypothetical protein
MRSNEIVRAAKNSREHLQQILHKDIGWKMP